MLHVPLRRAPEQGGRFVNVCLWFVAAFVGDDVSRRVYQVRRRQRDGRCGRQWTLGLGFIWNRMYEHLTLDFSALSSQFVAIRCERCSQLEG